MTQDPKGSIWRKWDLHLHTPTSYDYKDKSVTNQEFIDRLVENNIEVAAITDHHNMDVKRIVELQAIAKGKITILPGIEFRSDVVLSDPLHFIGIFPEDCDVSTVWDTIRVKLGIDVSKVNNSTEEPKLSFNLFTASELIHELGGIVTAHAGTKSNSFENITNSFSHTKEIKKNILTSNVIDILEVGKIKDIVSYTKIVFPNIEKQLPLIICTDNHNIKDYVTKENLWVKGDPNFTTLKQLLNQPDRAFIGSKPYGIQIVEDNLTKYIQKIEINKIEGSTFEEVWFNNISTPINPGLVAIIGNKGNGKSALTDIIGLCGNTHNYKGFSFLSDSKFKKNKNEKSSNYEATLTWANGKKTTQCLNHNVDIAYDERVKYIPQSHLETLCVSIEGGEFEEELRSIIFSHIPQNMRLGKSDLNELINHKTQIIRNDIEGLKSGLSIINTEILELETKENPTYLIKLQENLQTKQDELFAHQESKPIHQDPPAATLDISVTEKINLLRIEGDQINDSIIANDKKIGSLNKDVEILNQRRQSLKSLMIKIENEIQINRNILSEYDLSIDTIFSFSLKLDILVDLINAKNDEVEKLLTIIESNGEKQIRLNAIKNEIYDLQSQLNQPERDYQIYLDAVEKWNNLEQDIVGSLDQEGSIVYLLEVIKYVNEQLENDIKSKFQKRKSIVVDIFKKKREILNVYKELYSSVTNFIDVHDELMDSYKISFDTLFKENDLYRRFESYINFGSKGSFYGLVDGRNKVEELFSDRSFADPNDAYQFVIQMLNHIKFHDKNGVQTYNDIKHQLKAGNSPLEFYNFICGLDYLMPAYDLKLSNKNVSTLSPGERGALLLIFYLILDNNNIPLIIDQPEENLDNQSVYQILVPFIKMAKIKRQVIIVTHNPNLAVVCDADQIVHVRIDKENKNKVLIQSGGLENPNISEKIVEILEGTRPAFSTRINTYNLHSSN